jgi:hypothetical protein
VEKVAKAVSRHCILESWLILSSLNVALSGSPLQSNGDQPLCASGRREELPAILDSNDKHHSFPNVLVEILDAVFTEIEVHLGGWFGKKKKLKSLVAELRKELSTLRTKEDEITKKVKSKAETENKGSIGAKAGVPQAQGELGLSSTRKESVEAEYETFDDKIRELNQILPRLKRLIEQFFVLSQKVEVIFVELDDFYQLRRPIQPYVADYVHRLCKDVPLFFKIGTLRHSSGVRHTDGHLLRLARARVTFSRMSAAFAVQMMGFGF